MAITSIVDYLKKNNQDSSYNARKALAANNGISDYKGTAAQNTKLLQILQSGSQGQTPSAAVTAGNNATTANSPTTTATKSYYSTFKPTELTDRYKNLMTTNENNFKTSDQTNSYQNKMQSAEKPFKASSYTKSYKNKLSQVENSKPGAYQSAYESTINDILNTINNRGQFDVKNDANYNALYDQYREQYEAQANKAMRDTLASANAATGGYGSTYGQAVAQQAYDDTMQGLNGQNLNLLNLAYQMYSDDRANDYNKLAAYQGQDNTMYNRYRDTVSDWQNDRNYYANQYQQNYSNDRNAYENDRNYFSNQYWNSYNNDRSAFENDRNYFSNSYWNSFQNDRSAYENDRTFDYNMDQDALNRDDANYQNALQTAMGLAQSGLSVPAYLTETIDRYNEAHGLSGGSAGQMASIAAQALAAKKSSAKGSSGGSSKKSGRSKSSGKGKITDGSMNSGSGAGMSDATATKLKNGLATANDNILASKTLMADMKAGKRNSLTGIGKLSSIASSLSNRSNTPLTVDAVSSAAPVQDITNSHGNGWVYVEGMGRMTWDELESEIDNGKVVETMKNGVYTYRKA